MSHPSKLTLGGAGLEKTVPGSMRRQPLLGGAHGHTEWDDSGIEEKSRLNHTLAQVDTAVDRGLGASEG
jgi:hypothetical protein